MSRRRASRLIPAEESPVYTASPTDQACDIDHGRDDTGQPFYVQATTGRLCGVHRHDLDLWAREIADAWIGLALLVEPTRASSGRAGGRGSRAHPPVPIDLEAAALRDHRNPTAALGGRDIPSVPGVVASWLWLVDSQLPIDRPVDAFMVDRAGVAERAVVYTRRWDRLPSSVIAQLELLVSVHDWMAEQPWIERYWTQLRQTHQALTRKTDGAPGFAAGRGSRRIAEAIADAAVARSRR